ncbi:MAG: right-handed parallel beta-helix repeat-containing protein [Caldilineaceae bacterium]
MILVQNASASAAVSIGDTFLVNTTTVNRQDYAAVAMNDAGQFAIGWRSVAQDGSGLGVYAQRYDANGKAIGNEFQVNTYTTGDQALWSVDINNSGMLILVWTSFLQDGDSFGIFGQRYAADGSPMGGEFQINSITAGLQNRPHVALDDSGSFVVTWTDYSTPYSTVVARRFDVTGIPLGPEFLVDSVPNVALEATDIAMNAQGDFLILYFWNNPYSLYAHRYSAEGTSLAHAFPVSNFSSRCPFKMLAMDAIGNFVIVWREITTPGTAEIYGQRYDESGTRQGSHFLVDSNINVECPTAAMGANGDFVIAWFTYEPTIEKRVINVQPYRANGERMGERIQPDSTSIISFPTFAAIDAKGKFVVAWQNIKQSEQEYDVFAHLYQIYQNESSTTIVVNSTNDNGDGTCDGRECTLREAIEFGNTQPTTSYEIRFNIPGSGIHTIRPTSPLPEFNFPVVIDGYSQPGAQANTNPTSQGLNTILTIELDGSLAGGNGLTISGGTVTVRGLAINRFAGYAVLVNSIGNLEGNFIGVDPTGQVNVGGGALFAAPGSTLRIGDITPTARNLIVGSIGTVNGQIEMQGNLVGVDRSGLIFLGQSDISVGKGGITMGGLATEARNIIVGKINVDRSRPLEIQGNYIGVDVTGQKILGEGGSLYGSGNGSYQIINNVIKGSTSDGVTFDTSYGSRLVSNTIEAHRGAGVRLFDSLFDEVSKNTIDGNGGAGIVMVRSADNKVKISSNSIFNNGGLGIDLGNNGVTPNDIGDSDVGVNQLQNFPELTRLEHGGNNTVVVGTLNSKPDSSYHIELFYGPTCDESGYGEGEKFITGIDIATDNNGNREFGVKLSTLPDGYYVTATATDSDGNTSEFSKCIRVSLPPARITIMKETQPKSTQDFAYYGPFGKFYLDDAQPDDNDGFGSFKAFEVNPGTYNFAEGVFQSWYLADIVCSGTGSTLKDLANRSIAITVKRGDQLSCTFITQRRVNLQAIKFNDLNADGIRQPNEPTLTPWEFRFYKSDGTLINHKVTDANGSAVQSNVIPGSFKICETPKAGWSNTLPGQVDSSLHLPCYNLTLQPGQNASLLFGNTQAPVVRSGEEIDPRSGITVSELPDINEPEGEESIESEFTQRLFLPLISH